MLNDVFSAFADIFIEIDHRLEVNIFDFVSRYSFPSQNAPFLQQNMVSFIKVAVYSLFMIIPLAILRILRRENSLIFFLFTLTLITFATSTFAVFLGFFQLLFM